MNSTTFFNQRLHALKLLTQTVTRGYAAILFTERSWIGGVFLLLTFWFPNIGVCGLLAVLFTLGWVHSLKLHKLDTYSYLYNSLLIGLLLGAHYALDGILLILLCLSSLLCALVNVVFAESLWRTARLPALSIPFVVVGFIITFAAQGYGKLDLYLPAMPYRDIFISAPLDYFFTALGTIFFTPQPLVGLILFSGILITSRYLALLTISGFIIGDVFLSSLTGDEYSALSVNGGFNFILTALALGGIFTVPSWQSFVLAMGGAAVAALLCSALQNLLLPYGVSMMAVPFLVTTLLFLAGLKQRYHHGAPQLLLENPALPEVSLERVRLAKVRGVTQHCMTLAPPFLGAWTVSQGMNGEYTHQAPWQHALDFVMLDESGKSYHTSGDFLEDYYCFGLPILSPVYGQVCHCLDSLPDHPIGEVDVENNWGNYVLIWVDYQHYVLLAHLKQHSLEIKAGDWVSVGQKIAECGNTGRSPQPHIHLHVQQTAYLGSPTVEFVLGNVILTRQQQRQFYLSTLPTKNDVVSAQLADSKLAPALHLPVGKKLYYQFRKNAGLWESHCFSVILTLTGQFRLQAASGASVALIKTDKVQAFYDRNQIADPCLDLFLLHFGMSPLVNGKLTWQDFPSAGLLPLPILQKMLYHILPFGHQLHCTYQREWQDELAGWQQSVNLAYHCLWHKQQTFTASAVILPDTGCVSMRLQIEGDVLEARLESCGRVEDVGLPSITTLTDLGIKP